MAFGGETAMVDQDTGPPRMSGIRLSTAPAVDPSRAAGGLLGVAGGEAWRGARGGFDHGYLVTSAMFDLSQSYLDGPERTPVHIAEQHQSIPAPAWLLPIAIVHPVASRLLGDTLELAIIAGVPRSALRACVAYVELAARLFAGEPPDQAVLRATGAPLPPPSPDPPRLCGIAPIDALTTGVWALSQGGNLAELVTSLAHYTEPWVAAAAAGLLGVRDGCTSVPAQWFRSVPHADTCINLAPGLLQARGLDGSLGQPNRQACLDLTIA